MKGAEWLHGIITWDGFGMNTNELGGVGSAYLNSPGNAKRFSFPFFPTLVLASSRVCGDALKRGVGVGRPRSRWSRGKTEVSGHSRKCGDTRDEVGSL